MRVPKDGRKIGVVVHHVASMYPIEIQLATLLSAGQPITGVTWDAVDVINRDHANENDNVTREAALAVLKANSAAAGKPHANRDELHGYVAGCDAPMVSFDFAVVFN